MKYEEGNVENDYSGDCQHSDGGTDGTRNDLVHGLWTVLRRSKVEGQRSKAAGRRSKVEYTERTVPRGTKVLIGTVPILFSELIYSCTTLAPGSIMSLPTLPPLPTPMLSLASLEPLMAFTLPTVALMIMPSISSL